MCRYTSSPQRPGPAFTALVVRDRAKATKGLLGLVPSAGYAAAASRHPAEHTSRLHCHSGASLQETPSQRMGRSAKVARIGNFATHKKNVQKRSLVVEKRPKKSRQTYATSKAPARAPKKAVRDAPKKK